MYKAWIGTYTRHNGAPTGSRGVYRLAVGEGGFDACTPAAELENPAYLALSGDGRFLFAALESDDFEGRPGGGLASFAIRGDVLEPINLQPTGGRAPCHVSERDGVVYAANYADGTVSAYAHREGTLSARSAYLVHGGSGPDATRQRAPHAHFARVTPQGRLAVVDLGLDKVMLYRPGDLSFAGFAATAPGAGPRHLDFIGGRAAVVTELGSTVEVFDPGSDRWERRQTLSTLPDGFTGKSYCAAIHASPCGRYLVASNRGHDSLAVYRLASGGALERTGIFPCGGREPRDFAFTPDGRFIVCGLQHSGALALLAFDAREGTLADTGFRSEVPSPVCVLF